MRIRLSQRADADLLLSENPFALLVGMVLDQQIPLERAFAGPAIIAERIGGDLSPEVIAHYDPEDFAEILARKPAVHRYPASMAKRIRQLAAFIVEHYDGITEGIWNGVVDGQELLRRLVALPGFGRQKGQIFLALLGKQAGVRPAGWREAAGPYGEEGVYRSVADVIDDDSLVRVREAKRAAKKK